MWELSVFMKLTMILLLLGLISLMVSFWSSSTASFGGWKRWKKKRTFFLAILFFLWERERERGERKERWGSTFVMVGGGWGVKDGLRCGICALSLGLKSPQPNLTPNLNQMVEFNIIFCYLFYYKNIFLVFSPYFWVIFSI